MCVNHLLCTDSIPGLDLTIDFLKKKEKKKYDSRKLLKGRKKKKIAIRYGDPRRASFISMGMQLATSLIIGNKQLANM